MSNQTLTVGLFLVVVALTLYITFWASRQNKTATDYYAGGRSFSGLQNGLAIPAVSYLEAMRWRGPALSAYLAAVAGTDAVLVPVAPVPAPTTIQSGTGCGSRRNWVKIDSAMLLLPRQSVARSA